MRQLLVAFLSLFLGACAKTAPDVAVDDYEVQFRFINLGRETVTVKLDGEETGQQVLSLGSVSKGGHVTVVKQHGTVEARNFLADGTFEPVLLPFEFDTTTGEPATFVLRDSMPNRISMNVTVPKQTQGATFGERVRQSLDGVEIEGGVTTGSSCEVDSAAPPGTLARIGLHNEPQDEDCAGTADEDFVRPAEVDADATPYFIHGNDGELQVAWVSKVNQGLHSAGSALAQGASLLGGALPGGAVISSATRALYILNAHSENLPATVSINGIEVARDLAPGALVRVKSNLIAAAERMNVDQNGLRRGAIAGIVVGASAGEVELGSIYTGPCRPPYLCDFLNNEDTLLVVSENLDSPATVLKTKHDTVKNSVGNIRRTVVLATTSKDDTRGCVAAYQGDDTCVMGAAVISAAVSSVSNLGGGASSASYAATGRMLYPPKLPPEQGTSMRLLVEERGLEARRFIWDSPPGLTPASDQPPEGFAIVAAGSAVETGTSDQRALFFVTTTSNPWSVQAALTK